MFLFFSPINIGKRKWRSRFELVNNAVLYIWRSPNLLNVFWIRGCWLGARAAIDWLFVFFYLSFTFWSHCYLIGSLLWSSVLFKFSFLSSLDLFLLKCKKAKTIKNQLQNRRNSYLVCVWSIVENTATKSVTLSN